MPPPPEPPEAPSVPPPIEVTVVSPEPDNTELEPFELAPPPAPTYSNNGFTDGVVNSTNVKISGRDLILVQERERAFRR